jgi:hypothetical protein
MLAARNDLDQRVSDPDRTGPNEAPAIGPLGVKYQDTPKGEQRCENCIQFEAPSTCKTVDGTVAAQGWCMVYAKKPA